MAHAEAARLLERDGTDPERLALHLLRSEQAGDARVVAVLCAAAAAAAGLGAADRAARGGPRPAAPRARPG